VYTLAEKLLKIGELASLFGVTARTIRYYEELGLIEASNRTEGLHRRYPADAIVRLKRIEELKSLDLTLGQIREFFILFSEDPSGEKCRLLLIQSYEDQKKEEETRIKEAQNRIAQIEANIITIKEKKSFFSCPGEECKVCNFNGFCVDSEHNSDQEMKG
jgi:DNA-binding transcriptional MerR regulator